RERTALMWTSRSAAVGAGRRPGHRLLRGSRGHVRAPALDRSGFAVSRPSVVVMTEPFGFRLEDPQRPAQRTSSVGQLARAEEDQDNDRDDEDLGPTDPIHLTPLRLTIGPARVYAAQRVGSLRCSIRA